MKIYSSQEALQLIRRSISDLDLPVDNQGQLLIYTEVYRWQDGTLRDEPDPLNMDE